MPAKAGIQLNETSNQIIEQILPFRIRLLNQSQFPLSIPLLNSFLPLNGTFHCFMNLEPNQPMNCVSFCKSLHQIILMLPYTFQKIRGYSYRKNSITIAGKYVYARYLQHTKVALDSRFRGNDCSFLSLLHSPGKMKLS